MKLQTKLLLFLVPLVVIPLIAVGWVAYAQQRDTAYAKTTDEMTMLVEQLSINVRSLIETTEANATLFSESALLKKYLLTTDEEQRFSLLQPSILRLFSSYQRAYPAYYEIRILTPNGFEDTRATTAPLTNLNELENDSPYFRKIANAPQSVYSTIYHNPDNQKHALLVGRRIEIQDPSVDPITADVQLRGYLLITVSLEGLEKQVADIRVGDTGHVLMTDAQGVSLFHAQSDHPPPVIDEILFSQLRRAVADNTLLVAEYEGQLNIFTGRRIHDDLYVFALLPQSELFTSTHRLGVQVALITVMAIIVATALLFAMLKILLVNRIYKLRNAAQEVGRGNLSVSVDIDARDELGELASSFKEMGRNLQDFSNQVTYLAYHDSLTGLPNRLMFREYLAHAIAHAERSEQMLALLFLDIDNFKQINDAIGHHAGDVLLQEFADKLQGCLRAEDYLSRSTVARLGGDEFLILLSDLVQQDDASAVANRIINAVAEPFTIGNQEFHVTTSIGITLCPNDGDAVDSLIRNADAAMYHAKRLGKNTYQFYSRSMNEAVVQRISIERKLRRALARDEFTLHYQPLMNADTRRIVGVEALIRWHDPELGIVLPEDFIPIAEETGLVIPIGEWVLREACTQTKAWQDAGFDSIYTAVNISSIQVSRQDVHSLVSNALTETGLQPQHLDIELTETSIIESPVRAAEMLRAVKNLGVRISLDDFGTGYSSLSHLQRFPIDCLKIDRSFIHELAAHPDDEAIVSAIIAMGRTLNIGVIAEGVETEQQLKILRDKGCILVQGYLFGHPMSAEEITTLLGSQYSEALRTEGPAGNTAK